jgi:Rps23 Pro-64 3,4-dihydroxylase Tpa1-like proline 4-hydroxylase
MFDWESLNKVVQFTTPFCWLRIERSFPMRVARDLAASFPQNGFSESIGRDRRYHLCERTVVGNGRETEVDDLALVWKQTLTAFLSKRYQDFVENTLQVDLSKCLLRVRLYRYNRGDWMLAHTDPPDRVTTHLCYLSEYWCSVWGGELLLLSSSNIDDVAFVVPPLFNSSVMFCRTDTSFHAVRVVRPTVDLPRLAVIAQFVRS